MSGGEKTLTAVALLLAISSKPSPFCNSRRRLTRRWMRPILAASLQFCANSLASCFILITLPSARWLQPTCSYGITMQEQACQSVVAVRFEDWPEDGLVAEDPRVSA